MPLRYWVLGGDGNWGTTTNWATASGGIGGATVPTSVDDVNFDGNGNSNCTINASARSCRTFVVANTYTSTINFAQSLTVGGTVSLGSNMGSTGSGALIISTTANLRSSGHTCSFPLNLTGAAITYTLLDAWNVLDLVIGPGGSSNNTINGFSISVRRNLTIQYQSTNNAVSGTTGIILVGTGTFSGSGSIQLNLTFNTGGTINISEGVGGLGYGGGRTLTYTAGTINHIGGITLGTSTYNGGTMTLNTVRPTGTLTLLSNFNCINISPIGTQQQTVNGTFTMSVSGSLGNVGQGDAGLVIGSGNPRILMNGTGNIAGGPSGNNSLLYNVTVPVIINTTGTINIAGTGIYIRTLTYIAGTIGGTGSIWTGQRGGTNQFTTWDLGGATFPSIVISGNISGGVWNLVSDVRISRSLNISEFVSVTGVQNIASNVANTPRKITLLPGATQDLGYLNITDINAGDGQTLWVFRPTALTRTTNINTMTWPKNIASTFIK